MKTIGLALGEGGARGIAHIAYLKALDELGIKPTIISGSSMGALIGAFYASGLSGIEIENILDKLNILQYGKLIDFQIKKGGMIKGDKIKEFLTELLPTKNFEDLKIPLKVVASDYWTKKPYIFKNGDLTDAIRASISIPGAFKPVEYKDTLLIDGGCTNPVPFDIIRDQCDILIAIDVGGPNGKIVTEKDPRMHEVLFQTYYIMMASIVENMQKHHKVDIFEKPNTSHFNIFDFYKYKKIIETGAENIEEFKTKVTDAINS